MVMVKCARYLVCAARGGYFGQRGFGMEESKGGCRVFRGRLAVFYQYRWNTEGAAEDTACVRQMETFMARWVRKAYPMGQIIHLLAAVYSSNKLLGYGTLRAVSFPCAVGCCAPFSVLLR